MQLALANVAVLFALTFGSAARGIAQRPAQGDAFPVSTAQEQAVSPEALARLDELVESLVEDQEVVGAELLVIKNGHSILHEAYGWRDREAETPMRKGSVFCVRSMTKPVIGAAIGMLIDEERLHVDDPVAKHLPAFDVEGFRGITVEHLLTHTSGLPMSLIASKDLNELQGIQAVAALGAGHPLESKPGSKFSYSDQGTDTLTALIEVVSGMPAAEFVRKRLLDPLGMGDSACVMTENHPLRARACCKYVGTRGEWTRFWDPAKPPLFPFFLGSQGLYSTPQDYARFTRFWLDEGRAGDERLLSAQFVRRALTPGPQPFGGSSSLPGLRTDYGRLMQLWTGPVEGKAGEREVVAFGHSGSDGTWAWVFPGQQAMVLYFTQSRNNRTGLHVAEALGELFLGVPVDPDRAAPPFAPYLGYYAENERSRYQAIILDGDCLALETPGKRIRQLTYVADDRWKFRARPSVVLVFERDENGEVTGFELNGHREYRFEPSAELPTADELAARIAKVHRLDLLEDLGPIRMSGGLTIVKHNMQGEVRTVLSWPDRFREDSMVGEEFERFSFDGEKVWYASKIKPAAPLEGPRVAMLRAASLFSRLGDWRRWHPRLRVIQRIGRGSREVFVVRAGDTSAPAPTLYVGTATGRVIREDRLTHIDGMGRVGQRIAFRDFRDVSGMLLPFRTQIELANPMIGRIVTTVTDVELGVELPIGTFELRN